MLSPDPAGQSTLQSALLSQLLAGKAGGQGGMDLATLLAGQTGGEAGGLDLAGLLAAQTGGDEGAGPSDDRLSLALRWLEQRRETAAQSEPVEAPLSAAEIELQQLEAMQQARVQQEQESELENVMNSMYAELEVLRGRNDTLAAALGACYLCFGADIACPECGGRGRPGSKTPDAASFRHYVAPAVKRVRALQAKAEGVTRSSTGNGHQL
jgi:hypothetical protein